MCNMKTNVIIIALLIFGTLICCWYFSGTRENYGGAIKRIQRIPKNTCYSLCDQYYGRCMQEFQYVDAGSCKVRHSNCMATCRYTDFQRL